MPRDGIQSGVEIFSPPAADRVEVRDMRELPEHLTADEPRRAGDEQPDHALKSGHSVSRDEIAVGSSGH